MFLKWPSNKGAHQTLQSGLMLESKTLQLFFFSLTALEKIKGNELFLGFVIRQPDEMERLPFHLCPQLFAGEER